MSRPLRRLGRWSAKSVPALTFTKLASNSFRLLGTEFVKELTGMGKKVFLDLKFYDIGETVKRATRARCAEQAPLF